MRDIHPGRDRGVSTTVGYVLALTITALLISGLLLAAGGYVESQRERVGREELGVIGERVAMGIQDVDRMAGAADIASTIYVRVSLPGATAGASYSITVTQVANQTNQPYMYELHIRSDTLGVSETVPVRTHHEMVTNSVAGDDVVVAYRDVNGTDPAKEIIIQKEMNIPRPIGPHLMPHTDVVYVNSSLLRSVGLNESVTTYDASPMAIGPKRADFDGDGLAEIPYIKNSTGAILLIDSNNETQLLIDSGANADKTRVAVGRWKGSKLSVFYAGDGDTKLYRVTLDGTVSLVTDGDGNGIKAVAGLGDIDGDGAKELVYSGGSQQLRYLDDDGSVHKISNGGVGQSNGIGIGKPHDFNGNGEARVPFVDGSNNLKLVDAEGNVVTVVSGGVAKSPLGTVDIDEDGQYEVIFLDKSDPLTLRYIDNLDDVGSSDGGDAVVKTLKDANNSTVVANDDQGAA